MKQSSNAAVDRYKPVKRSETPVTKMPSPPLEARTVSTWQTDTSASESGGLPTHPRRAQRLHLAAQKQATQYHPSQLYHPQRGEEFRGTVDDILGGSEISGPSSSSVNPEKRRTQSRIRARNGGVTGATNNVDRYNLDSSSDCLEFTPSTRSPSKVRSGATDAVKSDFSRNSDGGRILGRSRSRTRARRRERGTSLEIRHSLSQDEGYRMTDGSIGKVRSRGTSLEARKTKLDKIYELLDENKALKMDNGTLRREILDLEQRLKATERSLKSSEEALKREQEQSRVLKENQQVNTKQPENPYSDSDDEEKDKMRHAMQALSKLSQAQGDQLRKLQVKVEDRAAEIEEKVKRIEYLEGNEEQLETQRGVAHRELKSCKKEISMLQQELVDKEDQIIALEEQRDKAKAGTRILVAQHEESIARADRLEEEIDALRRKKRRNGPDSSSDSDNVEELKKELARKIEHIVLLEFDLEVQKEELRALKDKKMMDETFPTKRAFVNGFGNDDVSFAEDTTWGSFTNEKAKSIRSGFE